MPEMDGLDTMIAIRGEFPGARIIVLTTYAGDVQVLRALRAGARAYLLKSLVRKDLVEISRLVHAGEKQIPPEVASELAEHAADEALSSREIEVLSLISEGNANKSRNVSCATQPAESRSPEVGQRLKNPKRRTRFLLTTRSEAARLLIVRPVFCWRVFQNVGRVPVV
jgi:CheY-like chemotaxis protein